MRLLTVVGAVLLVVAACGGPDQVNQGAPAGAAASATPAGVRVAPFESLQAFLPELPGWTQGVPRGETDTVEALSRVTVDYEKPPATLRFELMDSSMNDSVLALIHAAIRGENPELRPTTIAGFPAAEEWFAGSQRGSVHVLVGGRFMVVVTGESVRNLDSVREAARAIDLAKLATLK